MVVRSDIYARKSRNEGLNACDNSIAVTQSVSQRLTAAKIIFIRTYTIRGGSGDDINYILSTLIVTF